MITPHAKRPRMQVQRPADQPAEKAPRLLLTRKEAAAALAISERTLFTITRRDKIPVVHVGQSVRYHPADLEQWIREHTT